MMIFFKLSQAGLNDQSKCAVDALANISVDDLLRMVAATEERLRKAN